MKQILTALCMFILQGTISQNIVKGHYTISGGLLGAANFSKFRVAENENLYFFSNLDWAKAFMTANLTVKLSLEGYTDNSGTKKLKDAH
jgi:hypothetical protein